MNQISKIENQIGITDGKLAPCPKSPNCVSTQVSDKKHVIQPFKYSLTLKEAKLKILVIIKSLKRTRIINETENYIHAEFRTRTFKFVDDVEFYFDDTEKIIHFRSASRVGWSDMGVNRKRMENIRKLYEG
ncbi:hypothetical protein LCGC14_1280200 [marine sediment metagenome]|uniref:DUF1499 domain-containing protein n=1 Tax=marine sediment metagenome TaxID=412755 RepID=A0A0F9KVG9_9ZZZZ